MYRDLYKQHKEEEEELRQKFRCLWLKDGDKNTSFFHNSLKIMRATNHIERIMIEGRELRDQEEIKEAAFNHFSALVTADPQPVDSVDFLSAIENKITADQNNELDKEVTIEEIEWSIFSMAQDKAPGPDGFIVTFYRTHWEIIKKDFVRMVKNFFSKSKLGNNIKSSHLALIPKDPNPQSFDRFRPISLCNVSYKIITKILASRIKNLLPSLISENQGGFFPKRHITDNVILIQEAIHNSINRKEKGMIIKLDMANAFDRVNHQFLREVLEKFGVSSIFISRIMECISLPWTAPLINNRPSNFFISSRGLRQGCPLSPFLYIIMAETLSIHLEKLRRQKEITGISIARGTKEINHSLFADDTLLIGGASSLMARRFKKMLDLFLQVSGGKLNNNKCMLYTWNVPRHITQRISIILDIPAQRNWSHFMYLGLPLAKDSIKTEIWVKVIEKLRGKLQSWVMSWLNLAGRTTLIKSILLALPIYQFAITLAPANIHKHMELILKSFLWQGGKQDSKRFSLVKWDQVILPFEKGGIGIRILRLANMAMRFKLIWRILSEKGDWWTKAIKRKYLNGTNSNILVDPIADRQCTPVWKLIKKTLLLLKGYISRALGNGSGINIWTEHILGMEARDTLPNLRPLHLWMEAKKLKSLYDISIWEQNRWLGWKHLRLPHNLREQWADLKLSLTDSTPLNRLSEDRYMWDPNGSSYTIKEGKILTAENLRKRGILGPSICCLCREAEESNNHLFLECTFARKCWKLITSPLRIEDLPNQISLLQKNWGNSYPYPKKNKTLAKRLWNNIPPNLCWQIWIARNKCIFNNEKPNISYTLAKTTALISETLSANGIAHSDQETGNPKEMEWIAKFNYESRNHKTISTGQKKIDWKLRGPEEEIRGWIQNQKRPSLHFDGASKNNPRQVGVGGVIKDQQGKIMVTYEWGLGIMSNNKAEAYSLLLGTSILRRLGLQHPIIIGDLSIIIAAMTSGKDFNQIALNNIKSRIIDNLKDIEGATFKHVLRSSNKEADEQENKAVSRQVGQVKENE
eukprot:PITA_35972